MHNGIFFLFMTEGGLNILFGRCGYYWSVNILLSTAKKRIYKKKPKKKQKLDWNTDTWNRTWAVRVRVWYHSPYTIAEILEKWLIIISNHMALS